MSAGGQERRCGVCAFGAGPSRRSRISLRSSVSVGYVVTIQADGCYAMKIQGIAFSKGATRTPVAIHRAVRYRTTSSTVPAAAVDPSLPANAAMLAATSPLTAATTYNVRVSGYVQATKGGKWVQFKTRVWSFTT
jgi:hypothetical protein